MVVNELLCNNDYCLKADVIRMHCPNVTPCRGAAKELSCQKNENKVQQMCPVLRCNEGISDGHPRFEIATLCKASATPPTNLTGHRLLHCHFNFLNFFPEFCCSATDVHLEFLPSDSSIVIRVEFVNDVP